LLSQNSPARLGCTHTFGGHTLAYVCSGSDCSCAFQRNGAPVEEHPHPQIVLDKTATPWRRVTLIDDYGQHIQMSAEQFRELIRESTQLIDGISRRSFFASLRPRTW
jgi:hypothetical protein